jgi:uncharacterized surface protein with fasciclin (FAS1) repeats
MKYLKAFTLPFLIIAAVVISASRPAAPAAPTAAPEPTTAPTAEAAMEDEPTIVDVAVSDERFSTLVTALTEAGLVETLQGEGPFTVFAPTNDAFAALPEGTLDALLADKAALTDVLLYHVVPGKVMAADVVTLDEAETAQGEAVAIAVDGDKVMINESQVIIPDIEASNGVIHVVDAVLVPSADEAAMDEAMMEESIVDIAVADERFSTLVTALTEAGLVETLQGEGPFTVFAPTDDAFAALPEGTLDALLADKAALTDVLLYHVVAGKVMAADVVTLDEAETVQGEVVAITVDGDKVMVNDSEVIITDIEGANGVIHVVDAVLVPHGESSQLSQTK